MSKDFLYLEKPEEYQEKNSLIALIESGISKEKQLLKEYYDKLDFPGYFGFNWDAFWDCIRDFDWTEKNIIVIHKDLPPITEKDLRIYLSLLHEAINEWEQRKTRKLTVIFPKSEQEKIESILN